MKQEIIAGVFGKIFKVLAEDSIANSVVAKRIWSIINDYHFDYFLMGCDEELIQLGLGERDEKGLMKYIV